MTAFENVLIGPPGQGYSDGGPPRAGRGTQDGSFGLQVTHAEYQEAVQRGNVFAVSNQAAQAYSVALTTTYTGLVVSNPAGNTKDMVLLMVNLALSVAPAAIASIHLIGGWTAAGVVTHTAVLVPENTNLGFAAGASISTMKADSQATIPTPTYKWSLGHGFTAAALPGGPVPTFEAKGLFYLKPGGFIAIGVLTAVTGFGCMAWEEVTPLR